MKIKKDVNLIIIISLILLGCAFYGLAFVNPITIYLGVIINVFQLVYLLLVISGILKIDG